MLLFRPATVSAADQDAQPPTLEIHNPAASEGKARRKTPPHPPAPPPIPKMLIVAQGTVMEIELVDPVSSGKSKTGDVFRARVSEGVWVHGLVAVPPGATVRGLVSEAVPSGRVKGQSQLALTLQSIEMDGKSYPVKTETLTYKGEPHSGKHIGSTLMGALQGALYGVLFGGKTGAIIGAGAGAATGTASSVFTGKLDVEFAQGAKLMFETTEGFAVPPPAALPPPPPKPAEIPPAPAVIPSTASAASPPSPASRENPKDARPLR